MSRLDFFILLVLTLLSSNSIRICICRTVFNSTTDEEALVGIKTAIISGPDGILARNWSGTNSSFCQWVGVSCSTKHGRVTAINLSGLGLGGTISPHIGNLTFLQSLDLSFNNFTGFIPQELSNARRLKEINVGVNSLTGEIPALFASLPQLKQIIMNNNSFSGTIPPAIFNISRLTTLDLGFNSLTGAIPLEIGNVSMLETMNLQWNRLTGSIPPGVFKFPSIRTINLRHNNLTGMLPDDICDGIPRLRVLYLSSNGLEGRIPQGIHKCMELEDLRMPSNSFSGEIPSEIGRLNSLSTLALQMNSLTGSIPREFGNLTSLKILYMGINNLTGELPEELGNIELREISLPQNNLSGRIPFSIFNISTLTSLELSFNNFSGSLPSPEWSKAFSPPNLYDLYLHHNSFSGEIPSYIVNASKLTLLDINNNFFSGPFPNFGNLRFLRILETFSNDLTGGESSTEELSFLSSLTNCRYLVILSVAANPLNGTLPSNIGNLSSSLQLFRAFGCGIKGMIPPEMGNLTSLLSIVLYRNELIGAIPPELGNLNQLQSLYLVDNQLQGQIPPNLCQMRSLGGLYLSGNMLTGPIPECLGDLDSVTIIFLDTNQLNGTVPASLWNLRYLLALSLYSNYLNGNLSSQISTLGAVNQVDLSYNQFSGEIPSSIDGCESLESLFLEGNFFEGSIPETLGNVVGLRRLDLSSNNLSGLIPTSLENLKFLEYFNVSYNKLEGEIPITGPFVNFTTGSFANNSALCGESRFQVPPCAEDHERSKSKRAVRLVRYIVPPIVAAIVVVIIVFVLVFKQKTRKVAPPEDASLARRWRRISYRELRQGTEAFSETNLLGRGSFGSVFKGTLSDGLTVAVKVFNMELEGAIKSFDIETEILSTVRHRNLVRIIGCCSNTEFRALVLEYMPNGSLEKWLYYENYFLDMEQRLLIAIDVALALEYLHHGHTFPVVHCDIKPSNVLIDEQMTAHVGDFGIAKLFDEGESAILTNTLATVGYAAPEYGSEGRVSINGDVYSYGIFLLEMFTGKKPTADMFSEQMSLKDWVNEALKEDAVTAVAETRLLAYSDDHIHNHQYEKMQCLSSVFTLAMKCLPSSPEERINMIETVAALMKIKASFVVSNRMHTRTVGEIYDKNM